MTIEKGEVVFVSEGDMQWEDYEVKKAYVVVDSFVLSGENGSRKRVEEILLAIELGLCKPAKFHECYLG